MSIPPNISQRDLVQLAVLVCGARAGEKHQPVAKGTQSSGNSEPWRGYDR